MKLALEIINREIAQRELENKHDHLRKEISTKEIEELKQVVNLLSIHDVSGTCKGDYLQKDNSCKKWGGECSKKHCDYYR